MLLFTMLEEEEEEEWGGERLFHSKQNRCDG
jgi:hypothetical protein